jgi:FdhD protein
VRVLHRAVAAPPSEASVSTEVVRVVDGVARAGSDAVACEEPLEIQLGAAPLAVVMRTPGHDEELASGLLLTERVVTGPGEIVSVRHCSLARDPASAGNVVRAVLAEGVRVDLERLRRNLYASSSCGICGKATLDNALAAAAPLDDPARFPAGFFYGLPEQLSRAQHGFAETGGMHGAALFGPGGELLAVREDVGRHNAVDKVVGFALRTGRLPLAGHALLVSGRISFEIAQKALAARIPVVAAVSAPTSLAVELATRARMTLVAFLRGRSFNLYGARERVAS